MKKQLMLGAAALTVVVGLSAATAQDRPPNRELRNEPAAQSRQGAPSQDAQQNRAGQQRSQSGEQRPAGAAQSTGQGQPAQQPLSLDRNQPSGQVPAAQRNQAGQRQPGAEPERIQDRQRAQSREDRERAQTPQRQQSTRPDRDPARADRERSTPSEQKAQRREERRDARERTDRREQSDRQERRQDRADRREQREGRDARANLNDQQRTRISTSIARLNVRPLTSVNFSVAVGVTVPRSVRLAVLPADVVAIVPQYRGYRFALVRDEIVIVHPRTLRIVAVLPYGGTAAAQVPAPVSGSSTVVRERSGGATFTSDERQAIRRTVITQETTAVAPTQQIVVGEPLPETVVIREFPETVYSTVPSAREYRYFVRGQDVYLIEPRTRRVIEVIE